MGILQKIVGENLKTEKSESDFRLSDLSRPSAPCPAGHPLPYGLHHWLDPFGSWHCTECNPPAAVAMVRDQVLVDADSPPTNLAEEKEPAKLPIPAGFRIVAVVPPGVRLTTPGPIAGAVHYSQVVFADDATRAEQVDMMDSLAWFERSDARTKKQS